MRQYVRELVGTICACGARKGKGKSFCLRCYRSLPQALQSRLYCRVGEGYEQAFDESLAHLRIVTEPRRLHLATEDMPS